MRAVILTCVDCGYVTRPSSQAAAAYAMSLHSCDTQRERVARGLRRLERLAASGPEAPCVHTPEHPHGNRVRYVVDKCRCRRCRNSTREYERGRGRARMYGQVAYVPADAARAHVEQLQGQGMGWHRIADKAGISRSILSKLIYGAPTRNMVPSKRIRLATETAILAVRLDLAGGANVPGAGTRRRLQGLVAIGWSQAKLSARLGLRPGNFGGLIHGTGTGDVHAATVAAVAALYAQLWDQDPPRDDWRARIAYSRSVSYAARVGWVNDPHARPDVGKYWLADVDWLTSRGLTLDQVASRLGVGRSVIDQACRRGRRFDLLERMTCNLLPARSA